MTEKQFKLFIGKNYGVQKVDGEVIFDSIISMAEADVLVDLLNDLTEENEQLKSFIQKLTEQGCGKIVLANGNVYNVNAILTDMELKE